jgi:hypothetical protein
VAQASLLYADVRDLAGLNGVVLKQVEEFFVNYQKVRNIKVTILGRHGPRPGGGSFAATPSKETAKALRARFQAATRRSNRLPVNDGPFNLTIRCIARRAILNGSWCPTALQRQP